MRELEKYVQENFPDELEKVRQDFANVFLRLTDAEKTVADNALFGCKDWKTIDI